MKPLEPFDLLFVLTAFLIQVILILHFSLRRWRFETALRFGPFVYALGIPAVGISTALLLGGKAWYFWTGGFLYLAWAVYGYTVEYLLKIEWRNSRRWGILIPYICLYLGMVMFYWWPLLHIEVPLWYGYTLLYLLSTILNITSHKK